MNALHLAVVDNVRDFIEQHHREQISLRHVASALGYSSSYLTSLVRTLTGKPLTAWIIERRIAAAQELLTDPCTTVAEVAATVGFGDKGHFSRKFKKIVGMTPSEWRRQHTNLEPSRPRCPHCGFVPFFLSNLEKTA
jgi:AraC family transcriptional regulator